MSYYAHTTKGPEAQWEPLKKHLCLVAKRACGHATAFNADQEGYIAGLLHDLGKYSPLFLERLRGRESGLDHWTMGAHVLLKDYGKTALPVALAIQGHHIGLQESAVPDTLDKLTLYVRPQLCAENLGLRLTEHDPAALRASFEADGLTWPTFPSKPFLKLDNSNLRHMLATRLLFSALVDADYIETEAFCNAEPGGEPQYRPSGVALPPVAALARLQRAVESVRDDALANGAAADLVHARTTLFETCRDAGAGEPGIYTLTAPTGTGKTLAMLAFALNHAASHPARQEGASRRIISVLPYLNIIEQTAKSYAGIFPDAGVVLEDHSLADRNEDDKDTDDQGKSSARLLSQNWDAPIIVTTTVQFFESLFANRPGACRKLHRLANSIILLDEVQTLPPKLAVPTLAALLVLSKYFGATVLLATATQPGFGLLSEKIGKLSRTPWQPKEIAPNFARVAPLPMRYRVQWRTEEALPWATLAAELAALPGAQVLCIVNLKRHACGLAKMLQSLTPEGEVFHLSTAMCPQHRRDVLKEVQDRLKNGSPCRLIATQCVEAGVDIDFPAVYRALAPLEAILQAAGRCERHGRRGVPGTVTVFAPKAEERGGFPSMAYAKATEATKAVLSHFGANTLDTADALMHPEVLGQYFERLYKLLNFADVPEELNTAIATRNFPEVARHYRIIEGRTLDVLVPYKEGIEFARHACNEGVINAGELTRMRPYVVGIYPEYTQRGAEPKEAWRLHLAPILVSHRFRQNKDAMPGLYVLQQKEFYDPVFGLVEPGAGSLLMR